MAKIALGIVAFLAVFAVLVLVAGSIPPQTTTQAGRAKAFTAADRGHVIEHVAKARRADADRPD
jgi:hypothetical protein